eukprot:365596-Chlamydomonas_euryale.AAC.6
MNPPTPTRCTGALPPTAPQTQNSVHIQKLSEAAPPLCHLFVAACAADDAHAVHVGKQLANHISDGAGGARDIGGLALDRLAYLREGRVRGQARHACQCMRMRGGARRAKQGGSTLSSCRGCVRAVRTVMRADACKHGGQTERGRGSERGREEKGERRGKRGGKGEERERGEELAGEGDGRGEKRDKAGQRWIHREVMAEHAWTDTSTR